VGARALLYSCLAIAIATVACNRLSCQVTPGTHSILEFGATCDGVHDDRAAFEQADANSPVIRVTKGICRIGKNIAIHNGLNIQRGAAIAPDDGVTVRIDESPEAGPYQIFSGKGSISFVNPIIVIPEWWGAVGGRDQKGYVHDDYPAIVAACNSLPTNPETNRKLLSGGIPRKGAIRFRPAWYLLKHPITCSYGVKYYSDPAGAILELASGTKLVGPETFIFSIDPPANDDEAVTNEAFGTIVEGITFWGAGNSNVSGLLFYGAQGSRIADVSSLYTGTRGVVVFESPVEMNSGTIIANIPYDTGIGPAVDLAGVAASFDAIDVYDTNVSGKWRFTDVNSSTTTYNLAEIANSSVDTSARILVRDLAFERRTRRPTYLTKVLSSPSKGQYSITSAGVISFSRDDSGLKRIFYRTSTPGDFKTPSALPVAGLQIDDGSTVQIGSLFAEGNFAALNIVGGHGNRIGMLESHPSKGTSEDQSAAAVFIDSKSTATSIGSYMLLDQSRDNRSKNKYEFAVWDGSNNILVPAVDDRINYYFAYGSYEQDQRVANLKVNSFTQTFGSSFEGKLQSSLTADRTWNVPDRSGTIALTLAGRAEIGGAPITAGNCTAEDVHLAGVTVGMLGIIASTDGDDEPGFVVKIAGTKQDTATIRLCAITTGVPKRRTYAFRLFY